MNKKKKQTQINNRYYLIGLVLLCIGLMFFSNLAPVVKGPFKVLANITVVPMQQGMNKVGSVLSDVINNFKTIDEMQKENDELQARIDELTVENNTIQSNTYELERLQELYKLDQNYADYEKVAARVIGRDSGNWFNTFTINKGSLDGIKVDMNVMAGSGLVGIVTEVGPTWSTVRSIIDDESNVSAMILTTSDTCIVRGSLTSMNDGRIPFEQLENNGNVVNIGDQVLTSHISSKFVQGILIGYVTEINVDANNLTRSGYITPVVDFKNLQEVLIITQTKSEMTASE